MTTWIYKNNQQGGNGATGIVTTAPSTDTFATELAAAIEQAVDDQEGDIQYFFANLVPQICAIWQALPDGKPFQEVELAQRQRAMTVGSLPAPGIRCIGVGR